MSANVIEQYNRLRAQAAGLHIVQNEAEPLTIRRASLRAAKDIQPRQWLYGTMLVRRYISVLIAPGGVGKTALSIAIACAVARGKAILTDHVHAQANVLVCNLEDPEDEFDRRIAACMIHHGMDEEELEGRLFVINGRERRLVLASLDEDGLTIAYPDKDALVAQIRANNIGLVIVDPFVNSHELEENSNPHINAAARAWAEVANSTGCSVLLVHHTRKGATAGDMDAGRGASALMGAARSAMTLTAMTPEEAADFGVSEKERRLHIRLDDAKANLSPAAGVARWMRLQSVALENGDQEYPNGDSVQALEPWEPPKPFDGLTNEDCNRALDIIHAGPGGGARYTASRSGPNAARWAGHVLTQKFDLTPAMATIVIKTWLSNGVLIETEYDDPEQRKKRRGLVVDHSKRPD